MSLKEFDKLAKMVNNLIDDREKFALPVLSVKLKKLAQAYREDRTINDVSRIVSDLENKKIFISRGELKDLYKRFYSMNTKFASEMSEELGPIMELKGATYAPQVSSEPLANQFARDEVLEKSLAKAFDKTLSDQIYSEKVASKAINLCGRELCDLGLPAVNIKVSSGNEDFIMCVASFETPKGLTSIAIPVETVGEKTLIPEMFIGNNGPEDFSANKLESYIFTNAGKNIEFNTLEFLKVATSLKNTGGISSIDLALSKMASEQNEVASFTSNTLIGQLVDQKPIADVNVPGYSDPEAESFAAKLANPRGVAEFKFGKDKVSASLNVLGSKLDSFGFKRSQLKVSDVFDDAVVISVSLQNKAGFKVPVKMSEYLNPTYLVSNGSVVGLTKSNILEVINQDNFDVNSVASASDMFGAEPGELVEIVAQAMARGDTQKAEEALHVIRDSGDERAFKLAFDAFKSGMNKTASITKKACSGCSKQMKSSVSQYPVCSHTGLPVNKVYQDEHGSCRPKSRQGHEQQDSSSSSLANKVYIQ